MAGRLKGKVAVVTAAGQGIGRAIAEAFVREGATVWATDVDPAKLADLRRAKRRKLNALSTRAVDSFATKVGGIDILVNCAGVVILDPAEDLTAHAWNTTLAVNLTGAFHMCQHVGRIMLDQGSGKVINLASQAASVALLAHAAYCASKFGLVGLTKVLASEWGPRGITANTISPTVVMTDLGRKAWAGEKGEQLKAQIPTGRFAEPDEIAAAAVYLASNAADMINGAGLVVEVG